MKVILENNWLSDRITVIVDDETIDSIYYGDYGSDEVTETITKLLSKVASNVVVEERDYDYKGTKSHE